MVAAQVADPVRQSGLYPWRLHVHSVLANQPRDNVAHQRLSFFLAAGNKDPLVKAIAESKTRLVERKFPVTYREIPNMGHQYMDEKTLKELVRWIDSLDRQ